MYKTQLINELRISDKGADFDLPLITSGVNLQNNKSTEDPLFLHLNPLCVR